MPPETMAAFTSYSWPGNVRELQNLIGRAVIQSNDGVLPNPLQVFERTPAWPQKTAMLSCTSGAFSGSHAIPNFADIRRYRLGDRRT